MKMVQAQRIRSLIGATLLLATSLPHAWAAPPANFNDLPPLSNGETVETMFEDSAWIRIWVGLDAEYANFNSMKRFMTPEARAAQEARMRNLLTELFGPLVEGNNASIPPHNPNQGGGRRLRLDELTVIGPNGLLRVNRNGLRVLMSDPVVAFIAFDGHSGAVWARTP